MSLVSRGLETPGVRAALEDGLLKNFFPLRVTEPWHRLPREAVESPSLEIFKPHLDKVLCSLLWVTLLRQGVGLGDPQRSLPAPAILSFCDSQCAASFAISHAASQRRASVVSCAPGTFSPWQWFSTTFSRPRIAGAWDDLLGKDHSVCLPCSYICFGHCQGWEAGKGDPAFDPCSHSCVPTSSAVRLYELLRQAADFATWLSPRDGNTCRQHPQSHMCNTATSAQGNRVMGHRLPPKSCATV